MLRVKATVPPTGLYRALVPGDVNASPQCKSKSMDLNARAVESHLSATVAIFRSSPQPAAGGLVDSAFGEHSRFQRFEAGFGLHMDWLRARPERLRVMERKEPSDRLIGPGHSLSSSTSCA